MKAKNLFLKNVLVLTVASLIMRGLGMVFRVYISNILGSEGMGLYQLIFSVYLLASTVASAGITLAVTRLVSQQQLNPSRGAMQSLIGRLLATSLVIGMSAAVVLYFASPFIGTVLLQDSRTIVSLQVLSVSLPFMALSAALRGYFMARRKITFTSISQLAEQGVRFLACLGFLMLWGNGELAMSCFVVMLADTLGEIVGFALQAGYFAKDIISFPKEKIFEKPKKVLSQFGAIVAPVSMVRCINSGLYTIEGVVVPLLMTTFLASRSMALSQWGLLKGMALPLLMFPSSFLASFVMLLVPEISENSVMGKNKENKSIIELAFKFTFVSSIGMAGVFYLLAMPLGMLFYGDAEIGFYLRVLAPLMPFIYIENVAEGMLKGVGEQLSTLWFSIINSVLRIGLIYLLVATKGMWGFLLVMIVSNIVTSILHQAKLLKATGVKFAWVEWLVMPCLITVVACLCANPLLRILQGVKANVFVVVLVPVLVCIVVFAVLAIFSKIITKNDFLMLKKRR